jgi:hypothetical protein
MKMCVSNFSSLIIFFKISVWMARISFFKGKYTGVLWFELLILYIIILYVVSLLTKVCSTGQ